MREMRKIVKTGSAGVDLRPNWRNRALWGFREERANWVGDGRTPRQTGFGKMAKRDRDRVGDVRRLREARKTQFELNGALHLRFGGATVPRRRFFDFCRGVRDDRYSDLSGGEHNRAAGVPHQNRGFRAFVKGIKLFERHYVRLERGDDFGDSFVNILDSFRKRFGSTADDAGFEKPRSSGRNVQHGVTGRSQAGVDAQYNILYFSRSAQFDRFSSLRIGR